MASRDEGPANLPNKLSIKQIWSLLSSSDGNVFDKINEISQQLKQVNETNQQQIRNLLSSPDGNVSLFDKIHELEQQLKYISETNQQLQERISKPTSDDSDLYIPDLSFILKALKESNFDDTKWMNLGLSLGLILTTLKVIENDHWKDTPRCLMETLEKWLRRADNVSSVGHPSLDSLSDALHDINEHASADYITDKMRYDLSVTSSRPLKDAAIVDVVKDATQELLDQNKTQIDGLMEKMESITLDSRDMNHQVISEMKKEITELNMMNEKLKSNVDELNKLRESLQNAEKKSYELEKCKSSHEIIAHELQSTIKQLEELTKTHKGTLAQLNELKLSKEDIENQLVEGKKEINTLSLSNDELQKKFDEEQEYIAKLKLLSTEKDRKIEELSLLKDELRVETEGDRDSLPVVESDQASVIIPIQDNSQKHPTSGPITSGPITSGPITSGPITKGPATWPVTGEHHVQYELPVSGTGHSIHQVDLQPFLSFLDYHELKVPYYSFSTIENASYSLDFEREYSSLTSKSDHPNDDRVFVINKEGNSTVLAVLDGHDGSNASSFANEYMYNCFYTNDLSTAHNYNYMVSLLMSFFLETENAFFQRIQIHLLRRRDIQQLLPPDMPSYQAYQLYPELVSELQDIEPQLAGGTTVVIAAVVDGVLYVANTGDSRAVLVRKTPDGTYSFEQLSTDHTVDNPDELKRLSDLGLNTEELKKAGHLGMQENTRCIGDYYIKKGYREVEVLRHATSPPGIADPTVTTLQLDPSIKYLLLMTDGVYKSLEGLHDPPKTDTMSDLLKLIKSAELVCESNLGGLAAQVLDDIKLHHETTYYESAKSDPKSPLAIPCKKRDDMTLAVLYFGSQ